jgi:two-component system chemotaxis response regulator CheY
LSDIPHYGVAVAGEVPLLRVLLKMALEDGGFDVIGEASDPQDLLIVCQSQNPAVVLIDFDIEQKDLVRLIESILDIDPVIAVVVISDPVAGQDETVLAAGARAYLQKPFSMHDMTHTVRKVKPVY